MKKILLATIILSAVIFGSCKKDSEDVQIRYYLNDIHPGLEMDTLTHEMTYWKVNYYAEGEHHIEMITDKAVKSWSKTVTGKPGDIAYMYVEFNEDVESSMKFSAGIQFEKQLFKEARNWETVTPDTLYKIRLSGTVPFVY